MTASENNEKILLKIKNLLQLSNDSDDDEECQTAFLMAQKLMAKNKISTSEINNLSEENGTIDYQDVTASKTRLFWWERSLALLVSENFRVKFYTNKKSYQEINRYTGHVKNKSKKSIRFFGLDEDVELAKEIYILLYEAMLNKYHEHFKNQTKNGSLKDSYINGFISGLENKFIEQVSTLNKTYQLAIITPMVVNKEWEKLIEKLNIQSTTYSIPGVKSNEAYLSGKKDANDLDLTKRSIGEGE